MEKLVRDIMKIGVPTCTRETKLTEAARIMTREGASAIIVMDEFGACGVVSQTDLVHAFPRNFELLSAQDVMTDRIISVAPDSNLLAAVHLMQEEHVHQVFIMHDHPGPSRPSAVVTMNAIVRAMAGLEPERVQVTRLPPKKNK